MCSRHEQLLPVTGIGHAVGDDQRPTEGCYRVPESGMAGDQTCNFLDRKSSALTTTPPDNHKPAHDFSGSHTVNAQGPMSRTAPPA